MAGKITPAQRKALQWLARHDGEQRLSRVMISGHVAVQTIHNLAFDRLIGVRYARVWGSGKRPIEAVWLTPKGRAAVAANCAHDWRQVELDLQECQVCGVTRSAPAAE